MFVLFGFFFFNEKMILRQGSSRICNSGIAGSMLLSAVFHLLFPLLLEIKETGGSVNFGRNVLKTTAGKTCFIKMFQEIIFYAGHSGKVQTIIGL